jgi:hypothetical protein
MAVQMLLRRLQGAKSVVSKQMAPPKKLAAAPTNASTLRRAGTAGSGYYPDPSGSASASARQEGRPAWVDVTSHGRPGDSLPLGASTRGGVGAGYSRMSLGSGGGCGGARGGSGAPTYADVEPASGRFARDLRDVAMAACPEKHLSRP